MAGRADDDNHICSVNDFTGYCEICGEYVFGSLVSTKEMYPNKECKHGWICRDCNEALGGNI